jgi:uncharacterized membrane protein YdbT with pleckstrin-like domain
MVVVVEVVDVIVVVVIIIIITIITTTTITVSKGTGNGLNVGEFIPDRGCPREFRRSYKTNRNKAGNERIDVTLRRLRATTVAVEKQLALHSLSVCL